MTVAEHAPAQRTKDAVSERAHPFAVRPFVHNRTDGAVGLDSIKRWIGIRCHVTHGMSRNVVRCFCMEYFKRTFFPEESNIVGPRELSIAFGKPGLGSDQGSRKENLMRAKVRGLAIIQPRVALAGRLHRR